MHSALLALMLLAGSAEPLRHGRTPGGIAYDIQGTGPAVVLITGSNLDRRMWAAEAEWLQERFTVVRYDLRAHGQSDSANQAFAHVDDLFDVLDHLKIDSAALIGLSAGSTIALDAAVRAPHRLTRIVLAAPDIGGYVPKERPAFFEPLIAALQAGNYSLAQEVMIVSPLLDVPESSRAIVRTMVTENNRLWTVPRELMRPPAWLAVDHLEEIKIPVLVIVGEKDLAPQREQADVLARRVTGAQLVVVTGGGHLVNLTSAGEFKSVVLPFLTASARP
jgi:3-oxoadipate enol-lactonase